MGRNNRGNNGKENIPRIEHEVTEKDFNYEKFGETKHKPSVKFEPRNEKQKKAYEQAKEKKVSILIGSAGTGKTTIAVSLAIELLDSKRFKNIIFLRANHLSDSHGHLKGSLEDKIAPLVLPMKRVAEEIVPAMKFKQMIDKNILQPFALDYVEGITFKNSIVIVDEVQNANIDQLRMIMTRIDDSSKLLILGDRKQIKLKDKRKSCVHKLEYFNKNPNVFNFIEFNSSEIVRGEITREIEQIFEMMEEDDKPACLNIIREDNNSDLVHRNFPNATFEPMQVYTTPREY